MKKLRPYQQEVLNKLCKRLKEETHPLLINASVGAGKSLILSELLLIMERAGFRSLCLTLNSTLIQQNADTYKFQGGNCSIYCSALKSKDCEKLIVFASPNSICNGIRNKDDISRQPFNLIIVDECHNISPHNNDSMYMRLLNHYGRMAQEEQYAFRVVGLTGTPYRGKAISIIGSNEFFKEQVCNISTGWLISQGYLVRPQFGLIDSDAYDFSQVRVNNTGKFNGKELQSVIDKNKRLTAKIMAELQGIMKNRRGAFIFAATRKHCDECSASLPDGEWAIITGETPHEERKQILDDARRGNVNYLISVNCLGVGIDIPSYDVCAWLRPTESLVLYTQGIGRVLRLYAGKFNALVLDYAGNLDRHGDIDDPIINEALKPNDETEKDYVIPCYTCGTLNTIHSRRCIGRVSNTRCTHYFEFKACHECGLENDITSRACRGCDCELIDPNAKLSIKTVDSFRFNVINAEYWISKISNSIVINAKYKTKYGNVFESYSTNSKKAKNVLYAKFIKLHLEKPSEYYLGLHDERILNDMLQNINTPHALICFLDNYGHYIIKSKLFD